jgi:hypothetical protein
VLPVTVRLTDLTDDALTGTVTCAWSCRGADFASTAPRSQDDVPSSLPQPKLNPGAPPLAGAACSRRTASVTFPPVVQALTVHWAACPRSLLACVPATSTQRLTGETSDTVLAPLCALAPVAVPVAVGVGLALVGFALVGLALVGFALMVRVGVGVAEVLRFAVLGVADGVLFWVVVLFGFVGVADGVPLAEALRVLVRVADGLAFAVALAEVGVADSVLVGALVGVSAGVLAGDFTMDFVGVTSGLDFSVRVGAGGGGGSDGVAAELAE